MKTYCPECGCKMEYAPPAKKPNFCSGCGEALGVVQKKPQPVASKAPPQRKQTDDEDDEDGEDYDPTDATSVPDISGLEFEIIPDKPSGVTLGQIYRAAALSDSKPQRDPTEQSDPGISTEQALEDFRKEAGTLRPKNSKKE